MPEILCYYYQWACCQVNSLCYWKQEQFSPGAMAGTRAGNECNINTSTRYECVEEYAKTRFPQGAQTLIQQVSKY
jgi:hypothetical protein